MSFKKVYLITMCYPRGITSPRKQWLRGGDKGYTTELQRNKGRDLFPNPQGDLLLSWHILQTTVAGTMSRYLPRFILRATRTFSPAPEMAYSPFGQRRFGTR